MKLHCIFVLHKLRAVEGSTPQLKYHDHMVNLLVCNSWHPVAFKINFSFEVTQLISKFRHRLKLFSPQVKVTWKWNASNSTKMSHTKTLLARSGSRCVITEYLFHGDTIFSVMWFVTIFTTCASIAEHLDNFVSTYISGKSRWIPEANSPGSRAEGLSVIPWLLYVLDVKRLDMVICLVIPATGEAEEGGIINVEASMSNLGRNCLKK